MTEQEMLRTLRLLSQWPSVRQIAEQANIDRGWLKRQVDAGRLSPLYRDRLQRVLSQYAETMRF